MEQTNTVDSFSDAFAILDKAMIAHPRRELSALVHSEVQVFKSALAQEAAASFEELSRGNTELACLARELSMIGSERSVEIASRLLRDLDVQIQETPLLVLAGVALASFAVGLMASASMAPASMAPRSSV